MPGDAERLRASTVIVKGHADIYALVDRMNRGERGVLQRCWLETMVGAGVDLVVVAVSGDTEAHLNGARRALHGALELWDFFLRELAAAGPGVSVVRTARDLPAQVEPGRLRIVLALEGGRPLEQNLAHLRNFYRLGMRVLGMSHDLRNELVDGRDEGRTGGGLSRFGRAVVKEANRLGILLDISHISDFGFVHVVEASEQPVVVSHANSRAVFDHPRNVSDEQLRLLAAKGGVLGLIDVPGLVGRGRAPIDGLLAHLDHVVDVVGVEHVAVTDLGTERNELRTVEGAGGPHDRAAPAQAGRPEEHGDREPMGRLIDALLARGYADADVGLVLGGNMRRLLARALPSREVVG